MTSKERVLQAVKGLPCDRVPVLPLTRAVGVRAKGYRLSDAIADPALYVHSQIDLQKELGYDALWGLSGIDVAACAAGSEMVIPEDNPPHFVKHVLSDIGQVHGLAAINPEASPWFAGLCRIVSMLSGNNREIPVVAPFRLPFMTATDIRGASDLYRDLLRRPEEVLFLMELLVEPVLRLARGLREAGADLLWTPVPSANQDVMSRKSYERFVHPYHKRVLHKLREEGITVILHLCGNWGDRLDLVSREEAAVWHLDKEDLALVRNTYPEVALMGKVQTVKTLLLSTPEDVLEEARNNILDVQGRGFLLSGDCGLPPGTPLENLRALVKAAN
ncbi:MAG: uroporphyrinogen decarboxylase family protein [Peptococcaceae bacterium]|jgi:uroporphyrinogen decarboxylase|nr:uroporphyrinogen decarboxylase family protein [Peptococcaceae bacterium]